MFIRVFSLSGLPAAPTNIATLGNDDMGAEGATGGAIGKIARPFGHSA
jgi:hypothetical protein